VWVSFFPGGAAIHFTTYPADKPHGFSENGKASKQHGLTHNVKDATIKHISIFQRLWFLMTKFWFEWGVNHGKAKCCQGFALFDRARVAIGVLLRCGRDAGAVPRRGRNRSADRSRGHGGCKPYRSGVCDGQPYGIRKGAETAHYQRGPDFYL
ncbi:MAG TPA: hypothetical protein PLP25_12285, partial [Candidatus Limiplasma sp.]|nr:hypothetical protein [Candidatus Limiplasma sp.]